MPAPDADPRNAGRAFALVVADELVRHGVTDVVVAPGSRSTPLALAFAERDGLRLHVRIDERSASYLAVGLARATGRPVPVLCTSGTAAAHFHGAVLEADQARVPLLVLTADRPPELRAVGANQTVDQIGLYGSAVRWFCEVGVPESRADAVRYWRSVVSRAVAAAGGMTGPRGPVHLNVALREPLVPVDDGIGFPYSLDGRPQGAPWTAAQAADRPVPEAVRDLITAAARGVVVVGDGLAPADVDGVLAFAAAREWPVLAEPHSNARRGDGAVTGVDALLRDPDFRDRNCPDLVLACGRVGLTRPVLSWLAATGAGAPVVVVDRDASWWDATRTAAVVVAAAPRALAAVAGRPGDAGWRAAWRDAGAAVAAAVDEAVDAEPGLTEPRVARDLAARVPDGALLAVASSMPIRDLDLLLRPRSGLRVVANRGVSGIDGFVSTAVGAALGHAGRAWALAGDLSLLHDANGLLADPAPDLDLVVVNNDGGGIFSLLPQAGEGLPAFERLWGTPHGVRLPDLARAFGVGYDLLTTPADLHAAIAAPAGGIRLLEVRTDRTANASLHRRLDDVAAGALTAFMSRVPPAR